MTRDDLPGTDALREALVEQTPLLTAPPTPAVLTVRVRRALASCADLLDLDDGGGTSAPLREIAARALGWVAGSVAAFGRVPLAYAAGRLLEGERSMLLALVDDLDLLGLTLDHAYDAAHRGSVEDLRRQLDVVADRFPAGTDIAHLLPPEAPTVDGVAVREAGAEAGADGIPRMPIPEQPDPHHVRENP